MANKLRKIKIGTAEALEIEDAEAVHTINGYTNIDINAGTITFADTPITTTEINNLFPTESNGGNV